MAYINKPNKNNNKTKTEKEKLRAKLYNNKKWQKLRLGFLVENPICSKCGKNLATQVHHINSPFADGLNELERLGRLLDVYNLEAMCATCHGQEHAKGQSQNLPSV